MRALLLMNLFFLCKQSFSQSDSILLKRHVDYLCHFAEERNASSIEILNDAAQYIHDAFEQYATSTFYQRYEISGQVYRNVLASFGPPRSRRLIIGAHYDAKGMGADDNASGMAALLELARLLQAVDSNLAYRIDLVAWSGGETASDKPRNMGSYKHALSLHDASVPVVGVIQIESIGYYSDSIRSQRYPLFFYRDLHGSKGNFTALYERLGMGVFGGMMKSLFKQYSKVHLLSFKPLIRFKKFETNDFRSFVRFEYPVLLITDTGKFRNKNLHTTFDSPDRLNYHRIMQLVDMIFQSVIRFRE